MDDFTVPGPFGQTVTSEAIPPSSQYNKWSDGIRRVAPQQLSCSVFCGGKRCKYERGTTWGPDNCAIDGLYSHWITNDVLAMARPNTSVIEEFDIIGQFNKLGIKSVINLEIPGEHASCSLVPLHSSGFSYNPEVFMENGIYFYNYGWRDYGEASLAHLLDMVKVLSFSVAEGKVAIHCHAGLGRTGVLIACYLIYSVRQRANEAIRFIRSKRPGSVQSRLHILTIQQFEQFILPNCVIFCNRDLLKDKKLQDFTLAQYLKRQHIILHGRERKTLRHIPKILNVICERLLALCGRPFVLQNSLCDIDEEIPPLLTPDTPISGSGPTSPTPDKLSDDTSSSYLTSNGSSKFQPPKKTEILYKTEEIVRAFLCDHLDMVEGLSRFVRQYRFELNQKGLGAWIRLSRERNLYVLTALLLLWLEHLRGPLLGSEELTTIVLHATNHQETLRRLPFEVATTLDYLLHFIANLDPTEHELQRMLRRLAASLTMRTVLGTNEMEIHQGFHTINYEKSKPRKLSDGTLNKILMVLRGVVEQYKAEMKMPVAVTITSPELVQ